MMKFLEWLARWSSTVGLVVRLIRWVRGADGVAGGDDGEEPVPDGMAQVYAGGLPDDIAIDEMVGTLMLVGVGTYGTKALLRLLVVLEQSGRERLVGTVLVIEHDAQSRKEFEQSMPQIFRQRVTYGASKAFFGFGNRPAAWVMERITIWGPEIATATDAAIERYRRRPENDHTDPSLALLYLSPGGHMPVGLPVVERVRDKFNGSRIIACTVLPEFTDLRERFAALKPVYEARGVEGWMIIDNMGTDYVSADAVQAALITGLVAAPSRADLTAHVNNVFYQALPQQPGGMLIFQFAWVDVVAERDPRSADESPRYVVRKDLLARTILDVWQQIEENRGTWSVAMPCGDRRVIYDCVLTNLSHADMREVQDVVHTGRMMAWQEQARTPLNGHTSGHGGLRRQQAGTGHTNGTRLGLGHLFGQPNYATIFAPIPATIDPDRPYCRVIVLRLGAVADGDAMVGMMVKAPDRRYVEGAVVSHGGGR